MSNSYRYYYVYMFKCEDASYYSGVCNNVQQKLFEHNIGINPNCYTYLRRPVRLVYKQAFEDVQEAIEFERQLKGMTNREKKAFIDGDFNKADLPDGNRDMGYYSGRY